MGRFPGSIRAGDNSQNWQSASFFDCLPAWTDREISFVTDLGVGLILRALSCIALRRLKYISLEDMASKVTKYLQMINCADSTSFAGASILIRAAQRGRERSNDGGA
jgi:hypothetical protein